MYWGPDTGALVSLMSSLQPCKAGIIVNILQRKQLRFGKASDLPRVPRTVSGRAVLDSGLAPKPGGASHRALVLGGMGNLANFSSAVLQE